VVSLSMSADDYYRGQSKISRPDAGSLRTYMQEILL
jgi:hypothetical protein